MSVRFTEISHASVQLCECIVIGTPFRPDHPTVVDISARNLSTDLYCKVTEALRRRNVKKRIKEGRVAAGWSCNHPIQQHRESFWYTQFHVNILLISIGDGLSDYHWVCHIILVGGIVHLHSWCLDYGLKQLHFFWSWPHRANPF